MNPAEEMPSRLESVSWGSLAVSKLKFVGRRLCRVTRPFDYAPRSFRASIGASAYETKV
jgi:hypothetical protein